MHSPESGLHHFCLHRNLIADFITQIKLRDISTICIENLRILLQKEQKNNCQFWWQILLKCRLIFDFAYAWKNCRIILNLPLFQKTRFFLRNFFLRVLTGKLSGFGGRFLLQDRYRSFLMALPIVWGASSGVLVWVPVHGTGCGPGVRSYPGQCYSRRAGAVFRVHYTGPGSAADFRAWYGLKT